MMDMSSSPAHGRKNACYISESRAMAVTSPSIRRNDDGSRTMATNHSTTAAASSEPNLFSPRSTAAMALSSISQIFSTETQTVAARHRHHPTGEGTRTMPLRENTTSSSKTQTHSVQSLKTSNRKMANVSTMTHPQLPPPQSLFKSSSKSTSSSTNKDSSSPSYTENDSDGGAPLPFIPNLPPTDHHAQYRMVSGDAPPPVHRQHHASICTTDGTMVMPYSSHHDIEPHVHPHTQPYYYAAASHPSMIVMMKRQPSFPPSSMPDEQPSHSTYTSPQQRSHMTKMMTSNPPVGPSDTTVPNSHVKQPQRLYDLDSQMLPSNHPMMTMIVGQSHLQQQQQPYPPTATTTLPTTATMTPATGTKRDISSMAHVPNHWTTPFHPTVPASNSIAPHNHGTPSHNNNHCGSNSHQSHIAVTNHHNHHHPQQQEHHQHATPYHPIHRCSSYGSASSINQTTTHYDVGQLLNQQQQHQPQFLPPPPPQVVTSGPYHPRSVSWSNNEPVQWIPYSGPPQYMSMVPRQQQYYPTPSQMIPTPMYPYVTPTPHKKQKIGAGSGSTPSNMLTVNVFRPPRAPLTKKKKSLTEEKISLASCPSTTTPGMLDDHRTTTMSRDSDLTAIVDEAQNIYNRKNKSLGILAESFLKHFTDKRDEDGNDLCQEIMVDRLSMNLNVERRRIYDVVNILEALQVIIKMGKNTYHWMGRQHLPRQFALLQNEAIEAWPEYAAKSGFHPIQQSDSNIERSGSNDHEAFAFVGASNVLDPNSEGANKSLTRLSQLFLQAFLVGEQPLSLPQASDLMHGGRSSNDELLALGMKAGDAYPTDEKKLQQIVARGLKTKIRRLYDIANVFLSVGLLRKCENRSAKNSDFKRPQYFLNYHLSIHEIRNLYKTLPSQMIESRSPFSDDQLNKLRKTSSIQTKVKYFGLSEPTESGAIKADRTKSLDAESFLELSPPTNKNVLTQSLILPGFESHNANESSYKPPSSTMNLDSPSYVNEVVTCSAHSSSPVEISNTTTSTSVVESPLNTSSETAALAQCLVTTNLPQDPTIQTNDQDCTTNLHQGGSVGDDTDDLADKSNNDNAPVWSTATVSPNNSSTSMDNMLTTTSASPSSSSTTSVLSPRRVSLEK